MALESIPMDDCPVNIGQVVKVAFQRTKKSATETNKVAAVTKATFDALFTATDSTKMVVSPEMGGATFTAGDMITARDGNDAPYGVPIIAGRDATEFNANLLQKNPKVEEAIKKMQCESQLGVWMINNNGDLICQVDDYDNPTEYSPIPIRTLFVGDRTAGGLTDVDSNVIKWWLTANWRSNIKVISRDTLGFDPLTEWSND